MFTLRSLVVIVLTLIHHRPILLISLCPYICVMYENCIHKFCMPINNVMFVYTLIPREMFKESIKYQNFTILQLRG